MDTHATVNRKFVCVYVCVFVCLCECKHLCNANAVALLYYLWAVHYVYHMFAVPCTADCIVALAPQLTGGQWEL